MSEYAETESDKPKKATGGIATDKVTRMHDNILSSVEEMAEWARIGMKARRYYHSRQWDDIDVTESNKRLRITYNQIRRDIDNQKAKISEAEPTMAVHGRASDDWHMGQTWFDLLDWGEDWTGQWHDSVHEVRSRILDDHFQVGEAIEKVSWDQDEELGLGMVISERKDPFHFCWDIDSSSIQRRNASWMCEFEPVPIEDLEKEFPHLKGDIISDVPSFFIEAYQEAQYERYESLRRDYDSQKVPATRNRERAYRKEYWEKRVDYKTRYLLDGKPAMVPNEDGDGQVPMDTEAFNQMTKIERDQYTKIRSKTHELWVTVIVNNHIADEKLSEYDTSKNGHGEYPYAFYPNVWDASQSHHHGDIEYLMGMQDVINQATSRWLEAMFIANSQFLAVWKGSMPKNEENKLNLLGKRTLQKIHLYPGQKPPEFMSANPTSAQLYQAGIEWLKEGKDEVSGVRDVNRAAPPYELSGKAIANLQAEGDLLNVNSRKHIESGLKQATMLRIACFQQFFRGNRVQRIVPRASEREPYNLYAGQTEGGVTKQFGLQRETKEMETPQGVHHAPTGDFLNGKGEKGKVLLFTDKSVRKFDLRLSLEAGREKSRAERMEMATTIMQYMGDAAGIGVVKWLAEMIEVPNREMLFEELDKNDQAAQVVQQVEAIQEQTGMSLQEMAQLAMQLSQQQQAQPPAAAPPGAAPPGAQPPAGPPAGPPV